jgi:hypothetical protein
MQTFSRSAANASKRRTSPAISSRVPSDTYAKSYYPDHHVGMGAGLIHKLLLIVSAGQIR